MEPHSKYQMSLFPRGSMSLRKAILGVESKAGELHLGNPQYAPQYYGSSPLGSPPVTLALQLQMPFGKGAIGSRLRLGILVIHKKILQRPGAFRIKDAPPD